MSEPLQRRAVRVLPETVANQIAAGEVVERPASVVKELVENALDAQATRITVSVEAGGSKAIEVEDNGYGMSHEDALAALERRGDRLAAPQDAPRLPPLPAQDRRIHHDLAPGHRAGDVEAGRFAAVDSHDKLAPLAKRNSARGNRPATSEGRAVSDRN